VRCVRILDRSNLLASAQSGGEAACLPMFAVTFALPDESREFRKLLAPAASASGGAVETGTLDGVEVAVGHIGVGEAAAERGIHTLLRQVRPDLLICAG